MSTNDDHNLSPEDRAAIVRWLRSFEAAVRNRDFNAGRTLCAEYVFSFGTIAPRAQGIDELIEAQWQRIWPITSGFTFDHSSAHFGGSGGSFWVAVSWSSWGNLKSPSPVERHGRATIILRNSTEGLLAVHTHFSLLPASAAVPPANLSTIQEDVLRDSNTPARSFPRNGR